MDIHDSFAVNDTLVNQGTWIPFDSKSSFLIARTGNKEYRKLFSSLYKRHKLALKTKGDAAEALAEKIQIELFAKTILLGWRGEVKLQKVDIPYNTDNAMKVLAIAGFMEWVVEQSGDMEAFKAVQDEEDEKN